jgi:hypothetical protein
MATSRTFAYNSSQSTIYCADNFSTLSVGAFSADFSSKPGELTWWMGPDEDIGYIIAIPVPEGNFPSPLGNISTVKFFRTTSLNDSEFIGLSKVVTGQSFATTADARNYLVSNGYWTNYLDADAQTFITSAVITNATQKMAINNLVTNLKLQNLWTKMTAVYPIVGGNASAHSKNLINPSAFPLSISSGWTHTSEGMQAAASLSGAYADTGIQIAGISTDTHISIYSGTDAIDPGGTLMGTTDAYDNDGTVITAQTSISVSGTNGFNTSENSWYNSGPYSPISSGNYNTSFGHFINTTSGNRASLKAYINGVLKTTTTGSTGDLITTSLLIGNIQFNGSPSIYNSTRIFSFATAGSSLSDADALNLSTTIEKFQNALSRGKAPVLAYDQDLTNFLVRIYAAGGTVSKNELSSLITLVLYLKNKGIWSRLTAFYPMVGGTSASCAQNLISSSFTGTFSSGWTFNYSGATPNGTSAYMNTNFNFLDHGIDDNGGAFGLYMNSDRGSRDAGHGAIKLFTPSSYIYPFTGTIMLGGINSSWSNLQAPSSTSLGMFQTSRINSSQVYLFNNTTGTLLSSSATARNNINLLLGAANYGSNGNPIIFDNGRIASAYVTKYGLTSTELIDVYTGIQTFNTTLGRVTGKPIFTDPDVSSFFDRVYAAGGTSTASEAVAVNILVLELKEKGVWSQIKALYPFVGTNSESNSQNLKSSSYTGTFVGSWTFSNGVTSGGGHFNTGFIPSIDASVNGFSFGGKWGGTNYSGTQIFGAISGSNSTTLQLIDTSSPVTKYVKIGGSPQLYFSGYGFGGPYVFRRASSTLAQAYIYEQSQQSMISGGTITTDVGATPLPTVAFYFGKINSNGTPSSSVAGKNQFGFLGVGLTDQQAKDLGKAIYNYTSFLGRGDYV